MKDMEQVMDIIQMAQRDLKKKEVNQWQNGYPNADIIRRDIENGESFVADTGTAVIGTAVLSLREELTYRNIYEGRWKTGEKREYVVIHRIAVHDDYRGQGIAGQFLACAERMAKENGRVSIRIDTHPDNLVMQKWIKKNGFSYCGRIFLADGALRFAYEKCL